MKIWLFALMQSMIALMGLTAYFLADDLVLATTAAILAAVLGISHPLLAAHKGRKLEIYRDQQYQNSLDSVDEQLQDLLDKSIDPPLPHRATVAVALRNRFGEQAAELLDQYDRVVQAIAADSPESETLTTHLAGKLAPWSVGAYLQGIAALATGNVDQAHAKFSDAKQQQTSWIAPWLGWATAAYRQGQWDEIRENHPHLCGVELLPYGAGDEQTFLELSDADREELTEQFQTAATSLGNYYTIAEFCRSKRQIAASQEELKKVA